MKYEQKKGHGHVFGHMDMHTEMDMDIQRFGFRIPAIGTTFNVTSDINFGLDPL